MPRKRSILTLALVATLALLAGCGSGGEPTPTNAGNVSAAGQSSAPTEPAATDVPGDVSATSVAGAAEQGGGFAQADNPENLRALLETLVRSAEAGDVVKAATLTRALIPDAPAVFKALKADAPAATINEALTPRRTLPSENARIARMISRFDPKRTITRVYGANTAAIAANRPGGVVQREFPSGAVTLAQRGILRPGVLFYEVEFTEPGKQVGPKYHLFFWDGVQWRMLGPVWRGLS